MIISRHQTGKVRTLRNLAFAFLIPNAKKLAAELLSTVKGESTFSTDIDGKVDKIGKILSVINVLVLINLLLAVTHKYI